MKHKCKKCNGELNEYPYDCHHPHEDDTFLYCRSCKKYYHRCSKTEQFGPIKKKCCLLAGHKGYCVSEGGTIMDHEPRSLV